MKKLNLIKGLWDDSHEKQTPQRFGRYAVMLLMLLTIGVGQMWAYNFYDPYIYFNNADLKWDNAMLLVGHGSWSCGYDQTSNPISDTKLVYFAPGASWSDQDGFTVCNESGWDCRGDAFTTRAGYTTHIGLKYSYGFNWHESYYVTGTVSPSAITVEAGSPPSKDATQAAKKRDTGTTYTTISGSYPATLQLKGTYLSGAGTSARSTIESTTSTDGAANKTYGAVVTGLITHSLKDKTLSSGYYLEGWGTGSTPSVTTATYDYNISAATTVYAFFSKLYTLDFDRKGTYGTSTVSASVANYTEISSGDKVPTGHTITVTASPATGYEVEGWYSDASCTSAYTNGTGGVTISGAGNVTFTLASLNANGGIYCKFQKKTYAITLNDDGPYQGNGSATVQRGDAALTVISHASRTSWNLVGYWNTSGNQVTDSEGALLTGVSGYTDGSGHWIYDGDVTLYAHWSQTYSLTVAAGSNISSVTGSNADVTLNSKYAISATPNTGYRFSGWTASPAENGTFDDASEASTNVTVKNGSVTVTGAATEIMSSLSTSCHYDAGTPGYAAPAVSGGATNVGYETTRTITATAAGTGYTFAGWTLTNCTRLDGGAATATSITIRSNGDGLAATVVANYNEVLTTNWYISGDGNGTGTDLTPGSPFSGWGTSGTRMSKKTGHSTEEIYYCNITVSTVATTDAHFPFQVFDGTNHRGYNKYWITKENNSTTVYTGNPENMKFRPYVTGTYEFKVDNTGANPVLTVTWPVFNQVRISAASPGDASNVGNYDLSAPSDNVRTVTRTLKASTNYTFKIIYNSDWYGYDSGTFTRSNSTSSNTLTTSKDGGNMTLTTDYAGSYTFKFNESTKDLSIDFPEAYQVHYDVATIGTGSGHSAAITTSVTNNTYYLNGSSVSFTAATENSGYTFKGWYNNATGAGAKVTDTDSDGDEKTLTTTVSSSNNQFYAVYEETLHTEPVNVADYSTGVKGGTVSPTSVQAGIATAPEVTATVANKAWHFRYWSLYKVTQKAGETTGTNPTHINATEDGGNLTAYFLPRYVLQGSRHDGQTSGMPDFTTTSKWDDRTADFVVNSYTDNVSAEKRQVELVCTRTLEPNTRYKFEIFDRTSGKTMGHGDGDDDIGANNWVMDTQDATVFFNTTGRGTYTFTITHLSEDANNYPYVQISAPTSYQLTLGCKYADVDAGLHDGTTGGSVSATATEGGSTATIVNGNYIISGGSIAFTPSPSSGYTFGGWYKDASCTNAYTDGSDNAEIDGENVLTISSIGANVPVYAKFEETATDVTLANDTHGHVEVNGATVASTKTGITTSKTITAVPQDAAWHFLNWTVPDGVTRVSGALTDETITIRTTTSSKTVTANFEPRYELRGSLNNLDPDNEAGMPGWSTGAPFSGTVTSLGTADGVNLTCTRTLNPNSNYKFVIHDRELDRNMGYDPAGTDIGSSSFVLDDVDRDVVFWTAGRGDYTFNITCISNDDNRYPTVKLNRPASYILNLGWGYSQDGGSTFTDGSVGGNVTATATESGTTVAITNGQYVISGGRIDLSAHAADGYTFLGYYNGDGYNTRFSENANWYNENISAATTAYAKFQANAYAITFDATTNGGTLSGSNQNAIYNNTTITSCPVGVKEGYHFKGWYTAATDGELIIDASGNLQPDITVSETVWTDGSSKWKKLSGATVYAQYEVAQITNIALSPGTVVENNSTVTVTVTISPEPAGTTTICWRVLYDNGSALDPQPTFDPANAQGTSVSFTAPEASGMYKVEAVLHVGSGCAGTDLSTLEENFQVAGSHTVTVDYKYSGTKIAASTSVTGRPLDWSEEAITAPDIFGYTFSSWSAGDGITITDDDGETSGTSSSSATIKIKATYNGTLTANYTPKSLIYFKNTLGWSSVYVNFYGEDGYWDDKGSGNKSVTNRNKAMTRIGETDVWYYDYGAASITPTKWVSFTQDSQNGDGSGAQNFWASGTGEPVSYPARRADDLADKAGETGFYAATPMFVPLAGQTPITKNESDGGKALYYNSGYWTKYLPGTGYTLEIYNAAGNSKLKEMDFTSADELMPMKAVADLEANTTYKFQIKRHGDVYLGNSGTMTYANHGQSTPWEMTNSGFSMCGITTTAAGDYTFNFTYSANASNQYRLRLSVDYPVGNGDYRLVYTDGTRSGRLKPSAIVQKENDGSAIVSFFVRHNQTPVLRIQQATVDGAGNITWNEYPTSGTPTNQITGAIASAITKDTVYNFNLSMNGSGALSVAGVEYYSGNYYIRTDAANSKWDNYRTDPDHLMTYSEYLKSDVGYSHYYTHWVRYTDTGRKNVKFVIANDYSPCISDTLARETASGTWANIGDWMEEGGDLKRSANVRFMWDIKTNAIARAYVDGSQEDGSEFLLMLNPDSPNKIRWADESALTSDKVTFSDNGNWIYEANIQAQPGAKIKLKSTWGDTGNAIVQYFKGAADATETLIGGSTSDWYPIRIIYDFKTNRLVASYVPATGTISTDIPINADVMFIREHQGDIAQLTFSGSGAISKIETAYGVMRFNKWTINNKAKAEPHSPLSPELSRFERDLFYISFPFRVNLEEVFGFGTYGTHWIIEEYDGAARAAKGFWADSDTFWRFITNRKGKFLEPNVGYLLALDLDMLGEGSDVWANTEQVELYFPSYGKMPTITSSSVTYNVPAHACTINRGTAQGDRRIKDSHWNVISVPTYINTNNVTFANTDWITEGDGKLGPSFLYTVNWNDNSLSATSGVGYTYKAMHAYIVQYKDNITWTTSVSPATAPRRNPEAPKDVEYRLELLQNEQTIDQTFVRLSNEEEVSVGFAFGEDLSKEFNKNKANIYTMVTTIMEDGPSITQTAGNVLPMSEQTTVVPVGVKIASTGDYTFAIPEGTNGVGVTLIDNETGIRTSLSALDYTINLPAGTYDNRFVLEISPIVQSPTGIESTEHRTQNTDVHKVLIDNILYIVKDGVMYDARGARVQ